LAHEHPQVDEPRVRPDGLPLVHKAVHAGRLEAKLAPASEVRAGQLRIRRPPGAGQKVPAELVARPPRVVGAVGVLELDETVAPGGSALRAGLLPEGEAVPLVPTVR